MNDEKLQITTAPILFIIVLSGFSISTYGEAPLGDNCSLAIPITPDTEGHFCAYTHSFNLDLDETSASGLNSSCGIIQSYRDKYFKWTATSTGLAYYCLLYTSPSPRD